MSGSKSTTSRVASHDKRLKASGGRTMKLRLAPEANAALQRIADKTGESATALINRLLIEGDKASH